VARCAEKVILLKQSAGATLFYIDIDVNIDFRSLNCGSERFLLSPYKSVVAQLFLIDI